jgi:hypothetical protein
VNDSRASTTLLSLEHSISPLKKEIYLISKVIEKCGYKASVILSTLYEMVAELSIMGDDEGARLLLRFLASRFVVY